MPVFTAEQLREAGQRIFAAAGAPADIAAYVAGSLVESNLVGHDSHGVIRVPAYVGLIRKGSIVPDARPSVLSETPAAALVSGNFAFGQVAATFATELACDMAREARVAAVSVVRCNHVGRVGEYAELAAARGMVAMLVVGGFATASAAPHGGAGRVLTTNPLAFGVPASSSAPMILDFATTVVAEGKLQVARAKRQPVPLGWIIDKEGNPTTDVEAFYAGGALLPFGGHKGYGLSLMAEVLAGTLGGTDLYREGRDGGGLFVLALDPAFFRPPTEFAGAADALFKRVKSVPPAPGFDEVQIPGEPEQRSRARRLVEGISLPEVTWQQIEAVAAELGVAVA